MKNDLENHKNDSKENRSLRTTVAKKMLERFLIEKQISKEELAKNLGVEVEDLEKVFCDKIT